MFWYIHHTHMHAESDAPACACGRCSIIAGLSSAHARTGLCNLSSGDRASPHMHAHAVKRAGAHACTSQCTCTHMPSELSGTPRSASNASWPSQSFLGPARASQSFPRLWRVPVPYMLREFVRLTRPLLAGAVLRPRVASMCFTPCRRPMAVHENEEEERKRGTRKGEGNQTQGEAGRRRPLSPETSSQL